MKITAMREHALRDWLKFYNIILSGDFNVVVHAGR